MRYGLRSLLLLPLLVFALPSYAAGWAPLGPPTGTVRDLVTDPAAVGRVYAATDGGGIFRSDDAGARWKAVNHGIGDFFVHSLTIAPGHLWTGTRTGGIYRSDDGGATWTGLAATRSFPDVQALAVDPRSPAVVWAGTRGTGLYRSPDRGATWQAVGVGQVYPFIHTIFIHPRTRVLLVGTEGGGLLRSADGGATWQAVGASRIEATDITADPRDRVTVYAATTAPGGVLKSGDGGLTWRSASDGLKVPFVHSILIDPNRPDTLWAGTVTGTYRTDNAAKHWQLVQVRTGFDTVDALALPRRDVVLAGRSVGFISAVSASGVWRSVNRGRTWQIDGQGMSASWAQSIAISPEGRLWAGTLGNGVWEKAGSAWVPRGLGGQIVWDLVLSPGEEQDLWAATGAGLYHSLDGGQSWERRGPHDPANTTVLETRYVALSPSGTVWAASSLGLFVSRDVGRTWTLSEPAVHFQAVAVDPRDEDVVLAGPTRTTDGGRHWASIPELQGPAVRDYAFDPASPATVWAGTTDGLFLSRDEGASWSHLDLPVTDPQGNKIEVRAVAAGPGFVYVALTDGAGRAHGVLVSQDLGATWTRLDDASLTNAQPLEVVFDPNDPGVVYVGTRGGGVYRLAGAL
jgi:photosystem II stability/assembly factor-like uncharacterized protein